MMTIFFQKHKPLTEGQMEGVFFSIHRQDSEMETTKLSPSLSRKMTAFLKSKIYPDD